ncbi:hypothetical protein Sfum_2008 [Syntrophobacter fumaroxidans MPOB]|uniref:Uncharacterized protein n=1 Tax=Syntrophobacter fumaroxidans (strain DSM 10017 / MPOB) TaxID=335543 RepID=A0LJT9_SYNFM|nr:hypothetical protein Sfum_2008 [Syntrophobacter fumaroxidans MPOB]
MSWDNTFPRPLVPGVSTALLLYRRAARSASFYYSIPSADAMMTMTGVCIPGISGSDGHGRIQRRASSSPSGTTAFESTGAGVPFEGACRPSVGDARLSLDVKLGCAAVVPFR